DVAQVVLARVHDLDRAGVRPCARNARDGRNARDARRRVGDTLTAFAHAARGDGAPRVRDGRRAGRAAVARTALAERRGAFRERTPRMARAVPLDLARRAGRDDGAAAGPALG